MAPFAAPISAAARFEMLQVEKLEAFYGKSRVLDGISLTVNSVEDKGGRVAIGVNIIPHTAQVTTFDALEVGRAVNIEIDVLARYLQRLETYRAKA